MNLPNDIVKREIPQYVDFLQLPSFDLSDEEWINLIPQELIIFLKSMNVKITGHIFRILAELVRRINKYIEENNEISFSFTIDDSTKLFPINVTGDVTLVEHILDYFNLDMTDTLDDTSGFRLRITRIINGNYLLMLQDEEHDYFEPTVTVYVKEKQFAYTLLAMIVNWDIRSHYYTKKQFRIVLDRLREWL